VVFANIARPAQKPPPGEDARREQVGHLLYERYREFEFQGQTFDSHERNREAKV
jgi:hypothetical protein